MNRLLEQVKLDSKSIRLEVFKVNLGALRLYQRLDFKIVDQTTIKLELEGVFST